MRPSSLHTIVGLSLAVAITPASASAQSSCEALWTSAKPKVSLSQTWQAFKEDRAAAQAKKAEDTRLMRSEKTIRDLSKLYSEVKIQYDLVPSEANAGRSRTVMRIRPDSATAFGRQAQILKEAFGGSLVVDPFGIPTIAEAAYDPKSNSVLLSMDEAFSLRPGSATAHEVVHMAINALRLRAKGSVFDAAIVAADGSWKKSLEEFATYGLQMQWLYPRMKAAYEQGRKADFKQAYDELRSVGVRGHREAVSIYLETRHALATVKTLEKEFRRTGDAATLLKHLSFREPTKENRSTAVGVFMDDLNVRLTVFDSVTIRMIHEIEASRKQGDLSSVSLLLKPVLAALEARLEYAVEIGERAKTEYAILLTATDPHFEEAGFPDLENELRSFAGWIGELGLKLDLNRLVPPAQI